jgi:aryl-alcohol dehydrogenase-like predicted oxidoreductase
MIGLGGGSRFFMPVPDDEQGAELVRRAIDRGICFIETAANYGAQNESESRIGMAMKTQRSRVFLETKVDARDYDGAMREMERSLKLLQTDNLDLVLHHNLARTVEVDQLTSEKGADRAIRKMVDQKVVRFRGFSCHSPQLLLDGIKRIEPQAIQVIANATRVPDVEPEVLPLAKARGIAVIVMKSVGKGYFLPHNSVSGRNPANRVRALPPILPCASRRAPLRPVSTPFASNPGSNSPACLHGERIPHTFSSDPSYDLTSRKKHWPIIHIQFP